MVKKKDIIDQIHAKTRVSKKIIGSVINSLIEEIIASFKAGKKVEFRKFGVFYPCTCGKRKYKIPGTEKIIEAQERQILRFKTFQKD